MSRLLYKAAPERAFGADEGDIAARSLLALGNCLNGNDIMHELILVADLTKDNAPARTQARINEVKIYSPDCSG